MSASSASAVEALGLAERLTAIESPSFHAAGINAVQDMIVAEATRMGLAVSREPGAEGSGDCVLVRHGGGAPGILVLSHIDTVHPVGTIRDELPIRRDGDKLYGPGIYDMKACAMMALVALRDVAKAGATSLPVTHLFTPDEETGSRISRRWIEREAKHAKYALVTEPARGGGRIVTARHGVGRFQIKAHGRQSATGGELHLGRSAIRELAHQTIKLDGMTDDATGDIVSVGLVSGGTAVNVVPDRAQCEVDARATSLEAADRITQRVLGLTSVDPDVRLEIHGGFVFLPYAKTTAIASLFKHAQGLAAEIGFKLEDVPPSYGGSDGNITANLGLPTLDGLGVDGAGAHTLHEHILISSMEPRLRLFRRLLETLE